MDLGRRSLGLLGGAALLAGRPACAAATRVVRVGWLRAPNDVTLAKAQGSLETSLARAGAQVAWFGPFAAAAPALEALNSGALDVTVGSSTSCITALAAGVPLRIFAYQKMAPAAEAIIVPTASTIRTLSDLRGHRVAVNRGGTGEYLLVRAMQHAGLDGASVERVYLAPADAGPAFVSGHVDAWAIWDPFLTLALRDGSARVLADGAGIGSDNAVTTVASRAFARANPDLLRIVLDTLISANAWAVEHPAEAGQIWTRAMGLDDRSAEPIGRHNAVPTRAVTTADIDQVERVADWYVDSGIVPRRPDIRGATTAPAD